MFAVIRPTNAMIKDKTSTRSPKNDVELRCGATARHVACGDDLDPTNNHPT